MIEKLKLNPAFRKLLLFATKLLSILNQVMPKDENKVLFYDSARPFLDDNTEALYTYMKENSYDKKYKLVCCVPNQKKPSPFNNYEPVGSLKGVLTFLTSKYVFFSFGDFRITPSPKQIVINQWHGMPLKKIGKYMDDPKYLNEKLDNFTYILASSELFRPIMAKAFGCGPEKVLIMGSARSDYFFRNSDTLGLLGINRKEISKAIIWMPTFRKSSDGRFDDCKQDSETMLPVFYTYDSLHKLDAYLEEKRMILVIKIHPLARFVSAPFKNILFLSNSDLAREKIRLYEFIKDFDCLITDYSSIYFEYLLLDRPIAFTVDDQEEYTNARGFIFDDLSELMPGVKVKSEKDFFSFLDDLSSCTDKYSETRNMISKLVNTYTNDNCRRLLNYIGITSQK